MPMNIKNSLILFYIFSFIYDELCLLNKVDLKMFNETMSCEMNVLIRMCTMQMYIFVIPCFHIVLLSESRLLAKLLVCPIYPSGFLHVKYKFLFRKHMLPLWFYISGQTKLCLSWEKWSCSASRGKTITREYW